MSLWDDFTDLFSAPAGAGSAGNVNYSNLGGNLLSTALTAVLNIYAANTAQAGERARVAAIEQGNQTANANLAQEEAAGAPGVSYLRGVVAADPGQLNAGQQEALNQQLQTTKTQLATSGLRGAGQAQLDVLRGVGNNYIGNAVQSNIQRQQAAGSQLAQPALSAPTTAAYLNEGAGSQIGAADAAGSLYPAEAATRNATAIGQGLGAAASGAATTAAAPVTGQAMGDIATMMQSSAPRASSYAGTSGNPARAGNGGSSADNSNGGFAG